MDAPAFNKTLTGYELSWNGSLDVQVLVSHLEDDGKCEMVFKSGQDEYLIPYTRENILSSQGMNRLATRLKQNVDYDWTAILSYVTKFCIDAHRQGEPVQNANCEPQANTFDYLLWPLLVRNQPTTLFSPGGYGKSILSDLMAVSIQFGKPVLGWKPKQGNVLILDWETDINIHRRYIGAIKKGLGITDNTPILYRFCENDLTTHIEAIQKEVYDNKIDIVIVDSQMAATAHGRPGADAAQVAGMYYNALRTLKCTSLTIDHISKQSMRDDDSTGPYGSVVKYNRSRSQFELKQQQNLDDDIIQVALNHKKFNLGRKLSPIGIQVNFFNDEEDRIDTIKFENFEVPESFGSKRAGSNLIDDIVDYLQENDHATIRQIATGIGKGEGSVRTTMARNETLFSKDGQEYYLV